MSVVRYERDGAVVTLTINRPDKLNALNSEVLDTLLSHIERLRGEDGVRCAILTGEGKAFVAGADIAEMKNYGEEEAKAFSEKGHRVMDGFETLPFPVIAAVNGFALGGGAELALGCDFIHASEKAKFGQPEVKLGVIPGFGGTSRLARRVGVAMARELVYSGNIIRADEARRIGLANQVHAPEALMDAVNALAKTIASVGPRAVDEAKKTFLEGEEQALTEANRLEIAAFARCFGTADQTEGMAAFLEKRAADFKGA
ncbi:MAG: enoyl-CoA hydratase/isomerase family protein [Sandaracinaceae bacterium]